MAMTLTMDAAGEPLDDDAALLARWRERGDREALGRLFARHADDCWRLAYRLGGNAADADDALQQALIQAMRRARSHRGGSVRGWLLAITANAARDQARRARSRERHEQAVSAPPPTPPPDEETASRVRAAIARLPDSYAVPVVLAYVEGMTSEAIAAILGMSAAAVRKRCERALARLRADPALAGAAALPLLLGGLPGHAAPETCRHAALALAKQAPVAASASTAIALAAVVALAGAAAVIGSQPRRATPPTPPLAAVDAPAPPPPPKPVDPDAALLDQRVSFSLVQDELGGALQELDLALPPGHAFTHEPSILPPTTMDRMMSRDFTDVTVREALAALTPGDAAWHLSHGCLTFYRPHGEAPPPNAIGLDALRALLLDWGRTGNEDALGKAYADTSNFYDWFIPAPVLADDAELRDAVRKRITRTIVTGGEPSPRAIAIAGYLGLAELAPDFLRLLAAEPVPLPLSEATQAERDAAEAAVERRWSLIAALGWMRDELAVAALAEIARADGGWRIACACGLSGQGEIMTHPAETGLRAGYRLSWFERHRRTALVSLRRIASPAALTALRETLADRRAYAPRWVAARALVELGDHASLPALREALRLKREGRYDERWSYSAGAAEPTAGEDPEADAEAPELCWAVGRLGGADGVGELLGLVTDARLRPAVFRALSDLRDPRVAPALIDLLRRDRELALEFDREPDDPQGNHEPDRYLSFAVAAQGNAAALLIAALSAPGEDDAPWRRIAVKILGRTRAPAAAAWLTRRATDAALGPTERAAAARALGWTDEPEALTALAGLLGRDPEVEVRRAAVDAIAIVGVHFGASVSIDGAVSAPSAYLAQALAHDPDPGVRAEAAAESRRGDRQMWIDVWTSTLLTERDPAVLGKLVFAIEQARWNGVSKHARHRCLVALALAPDAAQPGAKKAVEGWLQNPNTEGEDGEALALGLRKALAAKVSDGVAGLEEATRALDAAMPEPAPPATPSY